MFIGEVNSFIVAMVKSQSSYNFKMVRRPEKIYDRSIYYDLIIQSLGDLIPRVLKIAGQGSAEKVTGKGF
ncbi:CLUMA_CG010477, isoform A [Clunio marinus]|uniref:CLUMA_CG010477, isoform A n=1 Tax=Clunio marinus TaxID=568069 RepID=A0A1J1IA13_9DIPT|nr:CLUMA_CG010477, isoform A [Clunio marinus]